MVSLTLILSAEKFCQNSAANRIKSSFKFLNVLLKTNHCIISAGIISTLTFVVL